MWRDLSRCSIRYSLSQFDFFGEEKIKPGSAEVGQAVAGENPLIGGFDLEAPSALNHDGQGAAQSAEGSGGIENYVVPGQNPSAPLIGNEVRNGRLLDSKGSGAVRSHSVEHAQEARDQEDDRRVDEGERDTPEGGKYRKQ